MASWLLNRLNEVNMYLSLYELPIIFILGNLGNLINIVIFSRRNLRLNVCSMYFICLSITHIILLDFHGIPRVIAITTNADLTRTSSVFCKIRSYLFNLSIILSRVFICLISIDRWFITSSVVSLRQLSSSLIVRRTTCIIVIFWSLFNIHSLFGFDKNLYGCSPSMGPSYTMFYFVYGIVISFSTLIIMILFSILALINIHKSLNRTIQPLNIPVAGSEQQAVLRQERLRPKRDTQLIRLSILQVTVFVLLNFLWTVFPLASFMIERQGSYTNDQVAIVSFLATFSMNLVYVYASLTFILYTFASGTFRRECILTYRRSIHNLRQHLQVFY